MPVTIDTSVLTGEGYAVPGIGQEASEAAEVLGTTLTVWGTPNSPVHDNSPGWLCLAGGIKEAHKPMYASGRPEPEAVPHDAGPSARKSSSPRDGPGVAR